MASASLPRFYFSCDSQFASRIDFVLHACSTQSPIEFAPVRASRPGTTPCRQRDERSSSRRGVPRGPGALPVSRPRTPPMPMSSRFERGTFRRSVVGSTGRPPLPETDTGGDRTRYGQRSTPRPSRRSSIRATRAAASPDTRENAGGHCPTSRGGSSAGTHHPCRARSGRGPASGFRARAWVCRPLPSLPRLRCRTLLRSPPDGGRQAPAEPTRASQSRSELRSIRNPRATLCSLRDPDIDKERETG